jgi:hypothetical protein
MQGVSFECDGDGAIRLGGTKLLRTSTQHAMRKIRCENGTRILCAVLQQGHGQVAGTAADVQHGGFRIGEYVTEIRGGATPPQPIDVGGEDVIEQVVARSDAVEHLLHGFGYSGLVLNTHRFGARCRHFYLPIPSLSSDLSSSFS